MATISGEPGVGKSRLLAELGRVLDDRPEVVLWRQGRCLPYGEGIAYNALSEVVKAQASWRRPRRSGCAAPWRP